MQYSPQHQQDTQTTATHRENMQNKIDRNNAIITQADKGKTLVINHKQEYHEKVRTFLFENNFEPTPLDP